MGQVEPERSSRRQALLALCLPVLVAIGLMVPRILDAHFGLLDDPTSISLAQEASAGAWDWREDPGFGRFRPIYWLAFSLLYALAGKQAAWYFVSNLLLLIACALGLGCIVLRLTQRPLAAFAAGIAFVLGGPVIEAAYTLSKPELLQCSFLIASAAVLTLIPGTPARSARAGKVVLAAALILLAALTKETAGLVLVIAGAWLAVAWLAERARGRTNALHSLMLLVDFLVAAGIGVAAYVVVILAFSPATVSGAGPQANFTFTRAVIAMNARIWLIWLLRDWLYLLPLLIPWILLGVAERRLAQLPLALGALIWMGPWLALYLPYRFTPEYYLLPFSIGSAVLAGVLVLGLAEAARGTRRPMRVAAIGFGTLSIALFATTIPNNVANARIQLLVDRANATMLRFVADTAPEGGKVRVNIRRDFEYLWQLGPMLNLVYDRPDLAVTPYLDDEGQPRTDIRGDLILSPFIENVPYPSVRLGIPEMASREWEASLQLELDGRLTLLHEDRDELDFLLVDASRLPCLVKPDMRYCGMPHTPFDARRFAAGWRVYVVR